MMHFADLPIDVILLLFPYLDARDFLSLTSCTPTLLSYRQEPSYWRNLTRYTFRIPRQPLLEADGARWQRLYKTLRTQTNVFTWGSNSRGNLGHFIPPPSPGRRPMSIRGSSGWPKEMANLNTIGVVADVQCGGWSTVLLNSAGQLWAVGVLNGTIQFQGDFGTLSNLKFPSAYRPTSSQSYEPSTAVREFSVGRWRALALSDDGRIWEWTRFENPAQFIKFYTLDTRTGTSEDGTGKVTKVAAGWSVSSAYVTGKGIVYWSEQPEYNATADTDGFMVMHKSIPGTAFRQDRPQAVTADSIDATIGEVIDYVVLDRYIVFITHTSKIYAWRLDQDEPHESPVELISFYRGIERDVRSIQGSFLRFGVFTKDGAVLIGNKDHLEAAWTAHINSEEWTGEPIVIPALQNSNVISLAFGDYHFQALHTSGSITSYGTESQGCGSLGLGENSVSHLRGVFSQHRGHGDGELETPSWGDGRRTVWFEHEKQRWLDDTCQKGATNEASTRVSALAGNVEMTKTIGEWFERRGRNWSAGPYGTERDDDDDDIDPYFGLKISAAGHATASLVLVNKEKAERVRRKYLVKPAFGPSPEQRVIIPEPISGGPQPNLLGGTSTTIVNAGRWLLSLAGRWESSRSHTGPAPGEPTRAEREEAERREADNIRYNSVYVWEEEPFPRLRLPDGTVMAGEVPLTPWKGGEPDFHASQE